MSIHTLLNLFPLYQIISFKMEKKLLYQSWENGNALSLVCNKIPVIKGRKSLPALLQQIPCYEDDVNNTKRECTNMIVKKFGTITAITTALVIGGGLSSVDASANTDKPVDSSFNTYDTVQQGDCNTYYHNNPSSFHFKWNMDDMKYEN